MNTKVQQSTTLDQQLRPWIVLMSSWALFRSKPLFFLHLGLIVIGMVVAGQVLVHEVVSAAGFDPEKAFTEPMSFLQMAQSTHVGQIALAFIVQILLQAIFVVGVMTVIVRTVRARMFGQINYDLKGIFPPITVVFAYLVLSFVYNFVVAIGLIALIIPGIYFAVRYGLYLASLTDGRVALFKSFGYAGRITQGHFWQVFKVYLMIIPLVVIIAIPEAMGAAVIGLLISVFIVPLIMVMVARAYLLLANAYDAQKMLEDMPEAPKPATEEK